MYQKLGNLYFEYLKLWYLWYFVWFRWQRLNNNSIGGLSIDMTNKIFICFTVKRCVLFACHFCFFLSPQFMVTFLWLCYFGLVWKEKKMWNSPLKCFGQHTNSTPENNEIPHGNNMAKLRICIPRSWQAAAPVWFHRTNGQHRDALWIWSKRHPSGTSKASDWNVPSKRITEKFV